MWLKLRSSSSSSFSASSKSIHGNTTGKEEETMLKKKNTTSPHSPLNVDEEYNNALRTKSFLDIWKKAHHHLKKTTSTAVALTSSPADGSGHIITSYSLRHYSHLPESLLDPAQETLFTKDNTSTNFTGRHRRLRRLLTEYFDITLEACIACTSLLACIDRIRTHHLAIRRLLIKFCTTRSHHLTISEKLTAHLNLENPLSDANLSHFHRTNSLYTSLIHRLAAARRSIIRRKMLIRVSKYGGAAVCGVLAVAALVVVVHSVVGVAVLLPAASLLGPRFGKRRVLVGGWTRHAEAQVDAALKGAYIVGRDLDTVSRMVTRLHYEVEHEREVARMAVRNLGERKLVKVMVREMETEDVSFGEQLKELEEHVYLCLLTINKSRRLLLQEMVGASPAPNSPPTTVKA